ncbi:MAG TPA: ABC transporter permease [Gemmatimonadaceae bacterium]|nr:ABC transporter permease [Gemmatimonadaceae bacterium]
MHEIRALLKANWQVGSSYRLDMAASLVALVVTVVPVYFVAHALQPMMAPSIVSQGGQYFGFVLVGMIAFTFLGVAVSALPKVVGAGIGSGTLEAYLATPARLPTILVGLVSYELLWSLARALLLLAAGAALGAHVAWGRSFAAVGVLALIVVAHLPFGLFGAALVLWFRTTGPLPKGVLAASGLLGGVYYPTQVIPAWLHTVSAGLPLTYGLRSLRKVLLDGAPFRAVAGDLAILSAFAIVLLALGIWTFDRALRDARRTGTLAQY